MALERRSDDVLRQFLDTPPRLSEDLYRRPIQILPQGNCIRCHQPPPRELNFSRLDYGAFSRVARSDVPFETEQQRQARELARFEKGSPLEKAVYVFSRLPEKASLQFTNGGLSLSTDFARVIDAVPGTNLDGKAREVLSAVKSVSLQGDTFTASLSGDQRIALNYEIPFVGKATELKIGNNNAFSFELALNPADPKDISLKKISGLSVTLNGKELGIREMSLTTSGKEPMLHVKIDNPGTKPERMPEALWPKTVTLPIPLRLISDGTSPGVIQGALRTFSDMRSVLQAKDLTPFAANIPEAGLKNTVEAILKGAKSIIKNGDQIQITRDNGVVNHDLGGPRIEVMPHVSFRLGKDMNAPRLYDISGIHVSVPLPEELRAGSRFSTNLKSIELGYADGNGQRNLTIRTGNTIDSLSVRVDSQMQPVRDGDGNFYVNTVMQNLLSDRRADKLDIRLRIDRSGNLNMRTSEVLNVVSRATGQAADLSFAGAGMAVVSVPTRVVGWVAGLLGW